MSTSSQAATQAYRTASSYRSQRAKEADVFHYAIAMLKGAKGADSIEKVRALADNRRLWMTVNAQLRDPANELPEPLRASILSVGATVQREMDNENPDFDFLISVNENIAAGLAGQP